MFADIMKQEGWMSEATLLLVHTNLSTINMHELRKRAGGMKVRDNYLTVWLSETSGRVATSSKVQFGAVYKARCYQLVYIFARRVQYLKKRSPN